MDTGLPFPPRRRLLGMSNYLQDAANSRCAPTSALRPGLLVSLCLFFPHKFHICRSSFQKGGGEKMGNGNLPFNMLPHASPQQLYTHRTLDWT